jgi:hypothetical protein
MNNAIEELRLLARHLPDEAVLAEQGKMGHQLEVTRMLIEMQPTIGKLSSARYAGQRLPGCFCHCCISWISFSWAVMISLAI